MASSSSQRQKQATKHQQGDRSEGQRPETVPSDLEDDSPRDASKKGRFDYVPMGSAPENAPLPSSPQLNARDFLKKPARNEASATIRFDTTINDDVNSEDEGMEVELNSPFEPPPENAAHNECKSTSNDGFKTVTGKKKRRNQPKLDGDLVAIVDGINRNAFPDRKTILTEVKRIAGNVTVLHDRELQAGGWTLYFATKDEYERFMLSPYWSSDAFGGGVKAHKPSGVKQDQKPYRVEPKKLRIDNVLNIFTLEDVKSALLDAGLQPIRLVDFKSRLEDRRPVMVEFATEEETKATFNRGYVVILTKRFNLSEMRDYSKAVNLCKRCQKVHPGASSRCQSDIRCFDCAGNHFKGASDCPVVIAARTASEENRSFAIQSARNCPNCGDSHAAAYGKCPYLLEEKKKSYAAIVADRENKLRAAREEQKRLEEDRKRRQQQAEKQQEQAPVTQKPKASDIPPTKKPQANTANTSSSRNGKRMSRSARRRARARDNKSRPAQQNGMDWEVDSDKSRRSPALGKIELDSDKFGKLVAAMINSVLALVAPLGIPVSTQQLMDQINVELFTFIPKFTRADCVDINANVLTSATSQQHA